MKKKHLDDIKKKSVSGVVITGVVQAVSLLGGFILSILLDPEPYGVFTIVVATTVFLGYFSDIGLAAALIQKKDEVTDDDLATTFTIQQILVVILVVGALVFSKPIADMNGFSIEGLMLFRALIVSFFLSSLKTIPSILLERDLEFKKLVIPQIVEIIVFNVVVVIFVFGGFGVWSFTWGILARSIVGVITIYLVKPWKPALEYNAESARHLISFGVPFQLNSILALIKDNIFIMILPFMLPLSHVGYIGWAKKWSEVPLRLFMDNIIRVTFPTFARLQNNPDKLSRGVNKTLFFLMLFIIPMSIGMVFLIEPLVHLIPKYEKWLPAVPSFYLFVIAAAVAGISTPLLNALNAINKISISLKFMILWTVMQWTIGPALMYVMGFYGFAVTTVIMAFTTIAVVLVTKQRIPFSLWEQIKPALFSSFLMTSFMFASHGYIQNSLGGIMVWAFLGAVVYLLTLYIGFKEQVTREVGSIVRIFRS